MFLKQVELFGFKSFADRVTLDFSDGIISLLGPNGCGKSNVVDSIKWVLGEQAMRSLRAGKMEDIIFNGTEQRKALNVAEVTLTIANEENRLPLDLPEIEIKRRIYRGGENEYFINSTPARLKEIRELFYDTGIGKSAYSILEQGKIDQILSHKPEDRRYIFEEAAGITRYKQKSAEAERKLKKTDENIFQVENIVREVRKTYESRKVQAEKAEQSRLLQEKVFSLEVEVQLTRIRELVEKYRARMDQLEELEKEYNEIKQFIDSTNENLEESLDEINLLSKQRIDMQTRIHRLEEMKISKENQIALLTDRLNDFRKAIHEAEDRGRSIQERIDRDEHEIIYKEESKRQLVEELEQISQEIITFESNIRSAGERIVNNDAAIVTLEHSIASEEERQQDLREELQSLTDAIVVELDAKLRESGYSYRDRQRIEGELRQQLKMIVSDFSSKVLIARDMLKTLSGGSGSIKRYIGDLVDTLEHNCDEMKAAARLLDSYIDMTPSFLDEFLAPQGIITRKRENDSVLNASIDDVKRMNSEIRDLREANRSLNLKMAEYRQTLENLKISQADMKGRAESLLSLINNLKRSVQEQELLLEDSNRDVGVSQERIGETKERIARTEGELSEVIEETVQLHGSMKEIIEEIERKNQIVQAQRQTVNAKYSTLTGIQNSMERIRAEREAVEHEMSFVYDTFEDTYSRSLKEFDTSAFEVRDDIQEIRRQLKSEKVALQNLGYINHMAAEEFKEVKERYDFLTRQIDDLSRAKNDLLKITEEITAKSEELFASCYAKLKVNFHTMFRRLFGGGRAELKLVDPDDLLNTGIDILAQPPGKKLEKISLLSGGERSLTAVALLFATYMVKPSPFCILDEIDAALDDANIGHFLNVLQEFSEDSQFIIITHNKKTVLGSKTLLGVTMEEPGVSKAVSYKIQDIDSDPSIAANG